MNEAGQPLPGQRDPGHTQQGRGSKIGIDDEPLFADGDIAHLRQVVEIEITRLRINQFSLRPAQRIVLHFQLDLVDPQLVERMPGLFERHR